MAFWRDDLKEFNTYILKQGMHLNFQLTWSWSYFKTSMFDFTSSTSDLNFQFQYVQCSIANKVKWSEYLGQPMKYIDYRTMQLATCSVCWNFSTLWI